MAWLQNLAGHAENLLNKIDQNAATVLNDGNKQSFDEEIARELQKEPEKFRGPVRNSRSPTPDIPLEGPLESSPDVFTSVCENQRTGAAIEESKTDKSVKSNHTSVSSNSFHNSFLVSQELEEFQARVAKLEQENQDVNKQLLNIQHLYSEVRNENVNLQFQVERLNEQLASTQHEKEQYIARAQRVLQEKEKLITMKQTSDNNETVNNDIFASYNEELKKELEFQQGKVSELNQKNIKLLNDLQSLQMQHQVIQQGLNKSNQLLEQNLLGEKKLRSIAEEDCSQKIKELEKKSQEIIELQSSLNQANQEVMKYRQALHRKSECSENDEFENRIKSLTQTLMLKQNNLETVTTERNALRLQLEKLEAEFKRNVAELKRDRVKIINVQDSNDGWFNVWNHCKSLLEFLFTDSVLVPNFMRVLPHDAGMTRRVKRAYSTLDAISVRTGIFLRRYPLARVFVFSYMVILHMWVFTVLLWDVPSNR
ncbi:golgin-84 isoform X1 [Dendroctonus ponderosae]|uniref:Uncharacterized protein n=1 Tax=Dendroctonus ponderosae TaxID=77166 RepID=U4TZ83_DENPD|nr:golgin-84 isoform X1 [Dendroctonus ponderosae]ERL86152.1 hypothetical protein D910_03565 [Dendroctonus ponderosae]